jgi:hypothetical protein
MPCSLMYDQAEHVLMPCGTSVWYQLRLFVYCTSCVPCRHSVVAAQGRKDLCGVPMKLARCSLCAAAWFTHGNLNNF